MEWASTLKDLSYLVQNLKEEFYKNINDFILKVYVYDSPPPPLLWQIRSWKLARGYNGVDSIS